MKTQPQTPTLTEKEAARIANAKLTKWAPAAKFVVCLLPGWSGSECGDDVKVAVFAHRSAAIRQWRSWNKLAQTMVTATLQYKNSWGKEKELDLVDENGMALTCG